MAAPGPSLSEDVAEACRGERIIAVNDAYRLLPWADVLYACDASWWCARDGAPDFAGERWTSHGPGNDKRAISDRHSLRIIGGEEGASFSRDPRKIHYGNNSGFQAVNLALLFGADPIILIGFDMREVAGRRHFFGNHKAPLRDNGNFRTWIARFERAAKSLGPTPRIINATPGSALTCFPIMPLADALNERRAA